MKKDPLNKQLANMIDYVSDMTVVMAAVVVIERCVGSYAETTNIKDEGKRHEIYH